MWEAVRPGRREGVGVAATQSARTGRARLKAGGARARAERTLNMPYMIVTLDVSKLSGWLNLCACCGVERRACNVGRGAAREAGGRWVATTQAACTRMARLKDGEARARAERTMNMRSMVVTLEVSQLEMSALKFFML